MRDFAKDIKDIRKLVIHEYNKQRNIILKDIKIHKKKKPAWNSDYRFYGTQEQNIDQYFGLNEQFSPEILNKLEIMNKVIINLAKKEFKKYFENRFHGYVSISDIDIMITSEHLNWPYGDKTQVLNFRIEGKWYSELEFANYLNEKYYYIDTLNKIKKINSIDTLNKIKNIKSNDICNPLELVMIN